MAGPEERDHCVPRIGQGGRRGTVVCRGDGEQAEEPQEMIMSRAAIGYGHEIMRLTNAQK